MVLVGIREDANKKLLDFALEHTPSVVIACANTQLLPFSFDNLRDIIVIETDILYTFKEAIEEAKTIAHTLGAKDIFVNAFDTACEKEEVKSNKKLVQEAWEEMQALGKHFNVFVGVNKNQEENALRYCG